ncbi:hypothetical protein P154DRAFT_445728 [Amniculicola lignicola CBS 123094]|uniref:DUF7730 domain-containing protein n=1 Tax=Amniculicola lignicola CBS 123094 TaxID=1392246 RepID=A0A6A5W865_9PLEO|nr:hypothetical protein P154DRAFT_445728 [Amniculicola lignicola CBS 123094]
MDRTKCPLLRVPVEIRLNIYDYLIPDHSQFHVHLEQDGATLSKCVNPNPIFTNSSGDHLYTGRERRDRTSHTDHVWARRLRSAWGPHWKCEEQHCEILDLLARTTILHITDLETIHHLDYANISSFQNPLQHIRELSITLRLPLNFFLSLEEPEDGRQELARSTWCKLDKILHQLSELRALRLYLDHDGTDTWTLVNERKTLEPITRLANSKDLVILVTLPKLHPKYEKEDRHFTDSLSGDPFPIRRMQRQQYHGIPNRLDESGQERYKVEEILDFPILTEFLEFFYEYSIERCEAEERKMWARGDDVERTREEFYQAMIEMRNENHAI